MSAPSASLVDELKRAVADADAVGLKGAQAEAARKVLAEVKAKEQCLADLRRGVSEADEPLLKQALQTAERLRLPRQDPAVQGAESELKRLAAEAQVVDGLARALSLPPHPLCAGLSIAGPGEVAFSPEAQRALDLALTAADKFGPRTRRGKQLLTAADVVQRVRQAIAQDAWTDVEQLCTGPSRPTLTPLSGMGRPGSRREQVPPPRVSA